MTDTPERDWASEIAESLTPYMGSPPRTPEELTAFRSRIASHLHKVKADTKREDANAILNLRPKMLGTADKSALEILARDLKVDADKIEKGLA